MNRLRAAARSFLSSEAGPTAVEYGVLLALVVALAIAAVAVLGRNAKDTFNDVHEQIVKESTS